MVSHVEIQTIRDDPTRLEAMTVQQLRTMMRQVLTNIHVFIAHIFIQGLWCLSVLKDPSFGGKFMCLISWYCIDFSLYIK